MRKVKPLMRLRSIFFVFIVLVFLIPLSSNPQISAADIDENMESTVFILMYQGNQPVTRGSGFVVASNIVVTNHHVIDGVDQGLIPTIVLDQNTIITGTVIWSSADKDLAIIQTDQPLNRPVVKFTRDSDVKVADKSLAMGFPASADISDFTDNIENMLTVKVTDGIISAKVKTNKGVGIYQHSSAINGGNSGGPLFSEYGTVIGINFAGATSIHSIVDGNGNPVSIESNANDIYFAIRSDELLVELDALGIPYQVVPRQVISSSTSGGTSNLLLIVLVGIAILLSAGALILAFTKKGKVVVQNVSKRILPQHPKPVTPGGVNAYTPVQNQYIGQGQDVLVSPTVGTKPYLIGISGEYVGQKIPIQQPITIGRSATSSQLVINAPDVSSKHCVISYDQTQGTFILIDLNSTNGTYLETGQRIPPQVQTFLRANQKFYLASTKQMFELRLED